MQNQIVSAFLSVAPLEPVLVFASDTKAVSVESELSRRRSDMVPSASGGELCSFRPQISGIQMFAFGVCSYRSKILAVVSITLSHKNSSLLPSFSLFLLLPSP